MQVWNVLRAARCKYRTQEIVKNSHLGTIAQLCLDISSQLNHISTIGKNLLGINISPHVRTIWWTSGWDRSGSLGHPCKFQRASRLGSLTARHSSIGRQPHFAAMNRGRQLYSAGRPSRWALAHISSVVFFSESRTFRWACLIIGAVGVQGTEPRKKWLWVLCGSDPTKSSLK